MKKLFLIISFLILFAGCNGNQLSIDDNITVPGDIDITYSKGNANAKVVITEYSEYQGPFCAGFTLDVLPKLQKDYIETGKILFIFKDYPIPNHQYAQKASEATYCAGEQNEDSFWNLHVKLFQNKTNLTKKDLIKYAGELELNVQAFTTCIESDRYKNLVLRNRQDGLKAGVNATPTILINDVKLVGLQPYENIVKIIETELKK